MKADPYTSLGRQLWALSVLVVASVAWGGLCSGQQIDWKTDLESAKATALETKRLVWLHFQADWCVPCQRLETYVFSSLPVIRAIDENCVAIKVDVDQAEELVKRMGVQRVPFDIFMTPSGRVLANRSSPNTAAGFQRMINELDRPLQLLNSGDRNEINFGLDQIRRVVAGETENDFETDQPDPTNSLQPSKPSHLMAPTTIAGQRLERGFESAKRVAEQRAEKARYLKKQAELFITSEQRKLHTDKPQFAANPFYDQNQNDTDRINPSKAAAPALASSNQNLLKLPTAPAAGQGQAKPWEQNLGPGNVKSEYSSNAFQLSLEPQKNVPAATNQWDQPINAPIKPINAPLRSAKKDANQFDPNLEPLAGRSTPRPAPPAPTFVAPVETPPAAKPPVQQANAPVDRSRAVIRHIDHEQAPEGKATAMQTPSGSASRALQILDNDSRRQRAKVSQTSAAVKTPAAAASTHRQHQHPTTRRHTDTVDNAQIEQAARSKYALQGKCPVTLLTESRWVDGQPEVGCVHRKRVYLFASERHRDVFQQNPDSYSPLLAGFDPVEYERSKQLIEGDERLGVFMGKVPNRRVVLFTNTANRKAFQANPSKYLDLVRQAMTDSAPRGATKLR